MYNFSLKYILKPREAGSWELKIPLEVINFFGVIGQTIGKDEKNIHRQQGNWDRKDKEERLQAIFHLRGYFDWKMG